MATTPDLTPDINFLYEMGAVRLMNRQWVRFHSAHFANQAEHHFRVFWIAMSIAAREKGADTGKIAKMCLAHDIAENRTGDVDYLTRQYCDRKSELAITDMLAGTAIEQEFLDLVAEYEARETLEAKIVKDADNLDVDFELREQAISNGNPLEEMWADNRQHVADKKLFTDTARAMYAQLKTSNPHDWHLKGRNRRNGGDWRK